MKKAIQFIAIIVMIWAGLEIYKWAIAYPKVEEELQEAKQHELHSFQQQYPNSVGWLQLQNTRIDNPIMQAENNTFYLTHNYKGEKSRGGAIFLDYRNDTDLSQQHTIFYGHVLRNETMFGSLSKYSEQSYAIEHPTFQYKTVKEQFELHVFAAYKTTTDFYYIETEFQGDEFLDFLQTIRTKSEIDMPVEVSSTDHIVTFSTCTTSSNDKERFVVHAKVVKK